MKKKKLAMLLALTLAWAQVTSVPAAAEALTMDVVQIQDDSAADDMTESAEEWIVEVDEELHDQDEEESEETKMTEAAENAEITEETLEVVWDQEEEIVIENDVEVTMSVEQTAAGINTQYRFSHDYVNASWGGNMLPNSTMLIQTYLQAYGENDSYWKDVTGYQLELLPLDAEYTGKVEVSLLDDQVVRIDSHSETGDFAFQVKVWLDGEAVYTERIAFGVNEYIILPESVTDASGNVINPEVGQQIDIVNDIQPQLYRYDEVQDDLIPVTGDDYKIMIVSWTDETTGETEYDYDVNGLKWIDVAGQDLPIMIRETEQYTWFVVTAVKKFADGNWYQIAKRKYILKELSGDHGNSDQYHEDDNSEAESDYELAVDYQDTIGNGDMLPNSQMTVVTTLRSKKDYCEITDYRLELLTSSVFGNVTVTGDGKNLLIQSGDKIGQGCVYVSVQIPDENGGYKEVFKRDFIFGVSKYVLTPQTFVDQTGTVLNPKVGQSIDLSQMGIELKEYKNGNLESVNDPNIKLMVYTGTIESTGEIVCDYEGWTMQEVSGQDLPIMIRETEQYAWFAVTAMEKCSDGSWNQIARLQYNFPSLPGDDGSDDGNNGESGNGGENGNTGESGKDDGSGNTNGSESTEDEYHENDNSEETSEYQLEIFYPDTIGNGAMLPNSQMTAETMLVTRKDRKQLTDYKLEIIKQSNYAHAAVSADEKNIVFTSYDKVKALCCCYISVQIPDGNGGYKEAFKRDIVFEVSNYILTPQTLTDDAGNLRNPKVGESIDLSKAGFQLKEYKNGGTLEPVTNLNIKYAIYCGINSDTNTMEYDYDVERWKLETVPGADLPILTRTKSDATWFAVSAMIQNQSGQWEVISRKDFYLDAVEEPHTHEWKTGKVTKNPTCTGTGIRIDTCTCGETKEVVIPAKGHTEVKDAAVAATAVTTGKTAGSHCSVCGMVLKKQTTVAKLKGTITLTASSLKMKTGQSTTAFKASGFAKDDYVTKVTSDKSSIVAVKNVKKDGTFTLTAGKKTGTATVTVYLASGTSKSFKVTVQKSTVKTTKITTTTKSLTLTKGAAYKKLASSITVAPVTSTQKITYSSSNKKVAAVSSAGVITAKKAGTAKITAKSGSKKVVVTVTVTGIKTTKLSGVPKTKTIAKGKKFTIKATAAPKNTDEKITYKTSDKKVATVTSKGVVKGVGKGTATITVQSGSQKLTCKVTVK